MRKFIFAAVPIAIVSTIYLGLGAQQTAVEDALARLTLPDGFSVSVFAEDIEDARSMTLGPDGTVFVGMRSNPGSVRALVDHDGDFHVDEVVTLASGLNTPNGVAFLDGALYVAELDRIVRFDGVTEMLAAPAANRSELSPVPVFTSLPSEEAHGWKYLAAGPDGMLYYQVGAPGNNVDEPDPFASIVRMNRDGSAFEVFARGVRNSLGMDWHPETGDLWFTDNGRDLLGDEIPNDELNIAPRPGLHFGYPYCHEGAILDPEFGRGRSCADYVAPVQKLGPHTASLGMKFYRGAMFPPEFRNQIFIARHGSWNRSPQAGPTGYDVMVAKLNGNQVVSLETFAKGWLLGSEAWGRPVDILELPDGSLLISDDAAWAIYRITYGG